MTRATDYFIQGELALAAYADLLPGSPDPAKLSQAGMGTVQANTFAQEWQVITQYNHVSDPYPVYDEITGEFLRNDTTTNGLSVTVFNQVGTNKRFLAIRGTDDFYDLGTDLVSVLLLGSTRFQGQYQSLRKKVLEWIGNDTLGNSFSISGHSLGGFLASGLVQEFSGNVEHAHIFNSPGFSALYSPITRLLRAFHLNGSGPDPTKISNIRAGTGLSPIAGLGLAVSPPIKIEIENQFDVPNSDNAKNHSQSVLTDALAIYSIYSALGPSLDLGQIGAIVKSASNRNVLSLERSLDALRRLLGETGETVAEDRNQLYANMKMLQESVAYRTLSGSSAVRATAGIPAMTVANLAKQDFGMFLAAHYLLPVAIEGAASVLVSLHQNLYAAWQADRGLSESAARSFTDRWYADRAAMLELKLKTSSVDYVTKPTLGFPGLAQYFDDRITNERIYADPRFTSQFDRRYFVFGSELSETDIVGANRNDDLFGGGGNDVINGGAGEDYIEGNSGMDFLSGSTGNDILVGGNGDDGLDGGIGIDTYRWYTGDGSDTISDSDKQGRVFVNGKFVRDLLRTGNTYASVDGTVSATRNSPLTLTTLDGATLVFTDFEDTDQGLLVIREAGGSDTAPTNTVNGTAFNDDGIEQGGQTYAELNGDAGGAGVPDEIRGGDGNDIIDGQTGEDTLYGDAGRDRIYGGSDNDTLLGGTEGDVLLGQDGDDLIVAGSSVNDNFQQTLTAAIDSDATPAGTVKEFLGGGTGNDVLVGGTGNDALSGGEGIDTLIGGAGSDVIWGDAEIVATNVDWSVDNGFVNVTGIITPAGVGGADSIYSGGGNDLVSAESGDDFVDAGGGDDEVIGHDGNDTIFGGTGNDSIAGDTLPGDAAHPLTDAQHGDDYLEGGDGNDQVVGGGGADTLYGGTGDDALFGDDNIVSAAYQGNDYMDGGSGNDLVFGYGGDDELYGADGTDYLQADAGDDVLDGGAGEDTLWAGDGNDALAGGADADILQGEAGSDFMDGGDGNDQIAGGEGDDSGFGGAGNDLILGDAGDDTLAGGADDDRLQGGDGTDTLKGDDGADTLIGEAGNDALDGGAGNDALWGGTGNDALAGGMGADRYFIELFGGVDTISDGSNEGNAISFGSGILQGDVTLGRGSLRINLPEGGEVHIEEFDPDNALDNPVIEHFSFAEGGSYTYAQFLERGIRIEGTPDADVLSGTSVKDIIHGLASDDVIFAKAGNDIVDGGEGNDVVDAGEGDDTLVSSAGADILIGGEGADTYEVNDTAAAADDVFLEDGFTGRDRVLATVTFDIAERAGIEDLYLAGTSPIDGYGSEGANLIFGNVNANTLDGRGGDDGIRGGDGDDILRGGAGSNILRGDRGNDTLYAGEGDDLLMGDGGNDTYVLTTGSGVERISETSFADVFDSFGGNDTFRFTPELSAGDVTFMRDLRNLYVTLPGASTAIEGNYRRNPNNGVTSGIERASFLTGGQWTDESIEALLIATPATEEGDAIYASSRSDTLDGLGGDDAIYGFAGDDVLAGGAGNDFLSGGDGNDVYLFGRGSGADTVEDYDYAHRFIPAAGNVNNWYGFDDGFAHSAGEVDTVRMAPDIAPSDVEVTRSGGNLLLTVKDAGDSLTLSGWAVDDLFEAQFPGRVQFVEFADGTVWDKAGVRTLVNVGAGTEGDDRLDGTDCPDTMEGRGGNDIVSGHLGNDRIDGGAGNDVLFGNEGDDILAGGVGNDTLNGGAGVDTYRFEFGGGQDVIVDGASEVVEFGTGIGPENVSVPHSGSPQVLFLTTGDTLSIGWGSGASLADYVAELRFADGRFWDTEKLLQIYNTGGAGADTMGGTPLADRIDGGLENDLISGDIGDDTYLFGRGSGKDILSGLGTSPDRVVMGAGVRPEDITVSVAAEGFFGIKDVRLHIRDTSDVLTIVQWNLGHPRIEFSDGTVWASNGDFHVRPDVASQLNGATEGTLGNDVVAGGADDDSIWTVDGDDTLSGGAGNDTLSGGLGNDTYLFARGDGADRIVQTDVSYNYADIDRIRFGAGIAPADVRVVQRGNDVAFLIGATDSLALTGWAADFLTKVDEVVFENGTVWTTATVQSLVTQEGTAGNDLLSGTAGDDTLVGLAGNDTLSGLGGSDVLDGGAGADTLNGGDGNDRLDGGAGNDTLTGNAGGDTYVFGHGYGSDFVSEWDNSTEFNRLEMNADLLPSQISVGTFGLGGGITITIPGSGDFLTLQGAPSGPFGGFGEPGRAVDEVRFLSDGTVWTWETLVQRVGTQATDTAPWTPQATPNTAPVLVSAVADASGAQGAFLRHQIPSSAFADANAGDALTYSLRRADGSALPDWIRFDAATHSVLATPIYRDIGAIELRVTATDRGGLSASDTFTVTIADLNDAPMLVQPLAHVRVAPGSALSYQVGGSAFSDVDAGDELAYSAMLADGLPLPAWLGFDAASRTLAGTPGDAELGEFNIRVTATDRGGLSASDSFRILVAPPPAPEGVAPDVAEPVPDQTATENQPFSFQVADRTFVDPDDTVATPEGDHSCLVWSAARADGSALPSWLRFNTVSRTFFGTPGDADTGSIDLAVTATDHSGYRATDVFTLAVLGVNDAPVAAPDTATVTEDATITISGNVLANDVDPDPADALAVANSGTYAGTYGTLELASDGGYVYLLDNQSVQFLGAGSAAGEVFAYEATDGEASSGSALSVSVHGANDAPQIGTALTDVHMHVGDSLQYAMPTAAFTDVDVGDSLALAVSLAGGAALPAWLAYDAQSGTISGTAGTGDVGDYVVEVIVADEAGATASQTFSIEVESLCEDGQVFSGTIGPDVLTGTACDDSFLTTADANWVGQDATINAFTGRIEGLASRSRSLDDFDGQQGVDVLLGSALHDAVLIDDGSADQRVTSIERFAMGSGNDVVNLTSSRYTYGDAVLEGGAGNDVLWAGPGEDIIVGGTGNDDLAGGSGADVYFYDVHDGHDAIEESGSEFDTLLFGEGIGPDSVRLERRGDDLYAQVGGPSGSVTLRGWFAPGAARVDEMRFADGTSWDAAQMASRIEHVNQGGGSIATDPGAPNYGGHAGEPALAAVPGAVPQATTSAPTGYDPAANQLGLLHAYDFNALLRALDGGRSGADALDVAEINRRWLRVAGYTNAIGTGDGVDTGVASYVPSWAQGRAPTTRTWGFEGSIGAAQGPAELRSLEGLREGFMRL